MISVPAWWLLSGLAPSFVLWQECGENLAIFLFNRIGWEVDF